ncbi:MAG: hypothetical protein ACE5PV_16145 [Candidatus Poribacteria bacterium]
MLYLIAKQEFIKNVLEDEKEYVRLAAVNALGKLGYKKLSLN